MPGSAARLKGAQRLRPDKEPQAGEVNMKMNAIKYLLIAAMLFTAVAAYAAQETNKASARNGSNVKKAAAFKSFPFYVYSDMRSMFNHYAPSGWMGDVSDLKIVNNCTDTPQSGVTCLKLTYSAACTQKEEWVGVYWQYPPNNWGKRKGYNLTGAKKLTFWARGEQDGVKLSEVKVGGIKGDKFTDTAEVAIGPFEITKEWKQYTLDLSGTDLSNIIGGFCVAVSREDNPRGCVFYLDEIVFE